MSAETLAQYGPWAVVSFLLLGIMALGGVCGVLYREILASHKREAEITSKVLPLIKELMDFLERRGRDSKWSLTKK